MTFDSRRGRIIPPDLDDRTWQDLVDEMRQLIPKYAPDWTDQGAADVGITLIELFAWLTEGLIYRLNQTPDKNYLAFLNLLGITRDPAVPARTWLTFAARNDAVTVPAGTQAQTAGVEGVAPVVFETDEPLDVLPSTLGAVLLTGPEPGPGKYRAATSELVGPPTALRTLQLAPNQPVGLLFGFDRSAGPVLNLGVQLQTPLPETAAVSLAWSYSGPLEAADGGDPADWPALTAVGDGTRGLRSSGTWTLPAPPDWTAQRPTAVPGAAGDAALAWTGLAPDGAPVIDKLFWVGLQLTNTATAPVAITVERLLFNSVSARTALGIRVPEPLGTATGLAFQTYELANRPVFRAPGTDPYEHLTVQVDDGSGWTDWQRVDELPDAADQAAEVYLLEPVTGEVRFGNYDPRPPTAGGPLALDESAGSTTGRGAIPPSGAQIRALTYRWVAAGAAGNLVPGQPLSFVAAPPGTLTQVLLLGPGLDGADEEPVAETLRRAPSALQSRDRAVTADDYEYLAREATRDVRIVRCLAPRTGQASAGGTATAWQFAGINRAPGNVTLIVVPDQGPDVPQPLASPELLQRVRDYLEPRRDLGGHLAVVGPRYLPVDVTVDIVLWRDPQAASTDTARIQRVQKETAARIQAFLHPTRGGPDGTGWAVGQSVFTADLFRALSPATDVGYVSRLLVGAATPLYHDPPIGPGGAFNQPTERPYALETLATSIRVADYELVCAGTPTVTPTEQALN